ncbi:microcephalin [Strongylocentrotus purpuratus]|uniref:BRCT domain-containing protein n=1 Tax=Strongylocentrotus purpuratus TaxID=7668 RepID=A0A7M7HL56_STRPU|nr:microcephalin [Strongylocentrotus purpuratus]
MGRKRNSREELSGGNELNEEGSGDTNADDAFLIMDSEGEDDIPNTQPADDRVLKDVVAYVEVRTKTENRSKGVSKQLELLGAKVEKKFTNDVTHVVWKDGKKSTRDRAVKKGIRLVSVLWVDSCKQNQEHVAESLFPVSAPDDKDVIQIGKLKRMKSMQPKGVEEDIQRSAGRGTRKRRARILHPSPAPLTAINPAILVAETQPMSPPVSIDLPLHTDLALEIIFLFEGWGLSEMIRSVYLERVLIYELKSLFRGPSLLCILYLMICAQLFMMPSKLN